MSDSDRPMSQKYNDDRRNHIPQMAFKVQNWPAYEAGLRRHGSAKKRGGMAESGNSVAPVQYPATARCRRP